MAIADAVGLAVFVALGTRKALEMDMPGFVAVIMGVVTGIAGGIIRDVLANRTPIILKKEVYALAALTGAVLYVAADRYGVDPVLGLWGSIVAVLAIRLPAILYGWSIPTLKIDPDEGD